MIPARFRPLRRAAAAALACLGGSAALAAGVQVQVSDARGAPLANAVVFALPASGRAPAAAANARAVIDQVDREFVPLVSVMQAGTSVTFPNKDDVEHSIYSFSPAKRFEIKLYSGVPPKPVVFDKAGLVVLGCNIHDSMVAYVMVVDTPWFGKTDAAGRVTLDNLPPGAYRVSAWARGVREDEALPAQQAQVPQGGANAPALRFTLANAAR